MEGMFSHNANFGNIIVPNSSNPSIYVSTVIHSATINVNEVGTVAAAATKVSLCKYWDDNNIKCLFFRSFKI